ncbi:hypothetical protein DFAR_3710008 [Desulfarculales bacterium]
MGTNRQWHPFYLEPLPVLADLVMDGDSLGIEGLYG